MDTDNINRKICVIGGGPAGLSCALWIKYLGMSPIILEKHDKLGGLQHINYYPNTWYMGIPGKKGQDFIQEFITHAEVETLPTLLNATPQKITREGDDFRITVGTSIPGIYAAGDVANQRDPCVATAVAQGTIAARSLEEDSRSHFWKSM